MDLKIRMSLFALVMLGVSSMVSAQTIQCYSCTYTYEDGEVEIDSQDCKTPGNNTSTTTCNAASSSCSVSTSISSSSSVTNQGSIEYTRGCVTTNSRCDSDCSKNPRSCTKCCTTNLCNTASLTSHLKNNSLTQTCYKCQYSEVPGTRSDSGCGLAFDTASSRVYEVECPGLCYSAKARFEHVEDILRGCLYHGNDCSYSSSYSSTNRVRGRDDVYYDLACCTGEKCNTATSIYAGTLAVLFSTLVGAVVTHL